MNVDKSSSWELRNITKEFPGVKALNNVNLKIRPGEIHGLMGENGSGKSTLVKCFAGVHKPTSGKILKNGNEIVVHDPMDARRLGIATIFQEFSLVPSLSVAENIFLGRLIKRNGNLKIIDWKAIEREASNVLSKLNINIDPQSRVNDLSVSQKQMVEIAKALSLDASLFIMDEPTAAIGIHEIENLHTLVRQIADQNCAVIYISHRMDEVIEIVDTLTVLKDGKVEGSSHIDDIDLNGIVKLMVGSDVKEHYPKEENSESDIILKVHEITAKNGVDKVSFNLHKGEVLGFAGLIGSGRTEIGQVLFGIEPLTSGSIELNIGEEIKRWKTTDAIDNGIAMITEDRKKHGLFMNFNGPKNITAASLKKIVKLVFLKLKEERNIAQKFINQFKLSQHSIDSAVENLSGGNQQKVVISRWIFSDAEIFIMDEPTRGIDVGAKVEVYNLINQLTGSGKGVIMISSDYPELIAMSDRIAFVNRGRIADIMDKKDLDEHKLMEIVFSQGSENENGLLKRGSK